MATHGASVDSDSQVCRDLRASFPAKHSSRSRRRFGFPPPPIGAGQGEYCIQAVSSVASWTTASQILPKSCSVIWSP